MEQAAEQANEALRLAPENSIALLIAGTVLLRQGRYGEAVSELEKAVRAGADVRRVAGALNDYGASLASRGQPHAAEPLVRKAIELNPPLVQARRNLVLVLADDGRREEARAALERAVEATGRRPEYRDLAREFGITGKP